ncbi:DUF4142 domain-containing protein [Marivirga sp.]|uniref:DUF4142 domain-containing protein n=1 Tax=Marivirga sp. TaxID=2018662 RepID=UPI002D7F371D|nr:DUF4142 domain-containing protein [Marivirga sp.]HET8859338.1 DUF4142 domain-containing protein [Marivirga sp.]
MKKNPYSKGAFLYAALISTIFLFFACDSETKQASNKIVASDRNDELFENNKSENEAEFLIKAAEINLKEIHFGQLAQQKGSATHVKELGKMMEDAHTKSQAALTELAKSKEVTIPSAPSSEANDAYSKLNEISGNEFDKAYADQMVKGHEEAIETFEEASENSKDKDVRNWANATLPELRNHLQHAKESQNKFENM